MFVLLFWFVRMKLGKILANVCNRLICYLYVMYSISTALLICFFSPVFACFVTHILWYIELCGRFVIVRHMYGMRMGMLACSLA